MTQVEMFTNTTTSETWTAACGCSLECHGYRLHTSEDEARAAWEQHGGALRHRIVTTTVTNELVEDTPRKTPQQVSPCAETE